VLLLAAIAAGPAAGGAGERRALSFEDRVRAQEAIERVRHAHQIGDTRPFEVAVPRSLLESKVRTFLKESAALERDWHGRVTAELLREETQRMARRTRVPDRLAELHAALGNDPLLIQECLVRPILTKRLLRSAVASSEGLSPQPASETQPEGPAERQDAERQDAERWYQEWWSEVEPRLEARAVDVVADVAGALPGPDAAAAALPTTCGAANSWQNASLDDDPEPLRAPGAVWTGTEMLVFGALDTISSSGARYDPAVDDWSPMSRTNAPSSRSSFAIAWTGSRLFVWGGFPDTNTGGLYDPTTDTWTPTSTTGAPSARHSASAVWTGGEVVVWGGLNSVKLNDGGRYDPQTDTWVAMSTVNAAAARSGHSAVWTGSVMVVWGGESAVASTYLNTGGRYDPVNDTWSATSTVNAPTQRFGHTAVWTGQRMVVWGGANGPTLQVFGGRYDPVADTWAATSSVNQPFVRRGHSAIWTGSRMIVWGGENGSPLNSGGRYDPVGDTWQTTSSTNAPAGRTGPAAVWTGSRMVVWGGNDFNTGVNTGGRYDPVGDTWAPMFLSGAPSQRRGFTTVWTGNDMIVWGGDQGGPSLATGGRYDPATDTWTPTTLTGVTLFATHHSAVWSGAEMIVWGGRFNSTPLATGGRYDPSSDTWIPVSSTGAPAARFDHSAIWDGSRLVVWGGSGASGPLGTGAAYDLFTDHRSLDAALDGGRSRPARQPRGRLDRQPHGDLGRLRRHQGRRERGPLRSLDRHLGAHVPDGRAARPHRSRRRLDGKPHDHLGRLHHVAVERLHDRTANGWTLRPDSRHVGPDHAHRGSCRPAGPGRGVDRERDDGLGRALWFVARARTESRDERRWVLRPRRQCLDRNDGDRRLPVPALLPSGGLDRQCDPRLGRLEQRVVPHDRGSALRLRGTGRDLLPGFGWRRPRRRDGRVPCVCPAGRLRFHRQRL
jgi:N-acetylneuraminic acid mutarotase